MHAGHAVVSSILLLVEAAPGEVVPEQATREVEVLGHRNRLGQYQYASRDHKPELQEEELVMGHQHIENLCGAEGFAEHGL
jgi:hypothetical protein